MIKSFFLNKKWAFWAWGGFLFIIGSLLAQTWIDVKINEWYKNFYFSDKLYENFTILQIEKYKKLLIKKETK